MAASSLDGIAATVRVVTVPAPYKDVSQWKPRRSDMDTLLQSATEPGAAPDPNLHSQDVMQACKSIREYWNGPGKVELFNFGAWMPSLERA